MVQYPILAIDFGQKHFGIAISDFKGIVATPLEVLSITEKRKQDFIIEEIKKICDEYKAKTILLGSPQIFIQAHSKTPKRIEKFKQKLEQNINIPIQMYDESFSTTSAQNMLTSSGYSVKGTREKIDKVAAAVFLQEFLNSIKK